MRSNLFPVWQVPEERRCKAQSKQAKRRCKNWTTSGKAVCRFHGGGSTGPKTKESKAQSSKNSFKTGKHTADKVKARRQIARALIGANKAGRLTDEQADKIIDVLEENSGAVTISQLLRCHNKAQESIDRKTTEFLKNV